MHIPENMHGNWECILYFNIGHLLSISIFSGHQVRVTCCYEMPQQHLFPKVHISVGDGMWELLWENQTQSS